MTYVVVEYNNAHRISAAGSRIVKRKVQTQTRILVGSIKKHDEYEILNFQKSNNSSPSLCTCVVCITYV